MPSIVSELGLTVDTLPHFSIVCHAKERLYMPNCRRFLSHTANLRELGDLQAIDASGFDRVAASRKYAQGIVYTFKAMKTTTLVDCKSGKILAMSIVRRTAHTIPKSAE